mmetsp:Transcript_106591/g.340032  ORF Transcript_106591/g.340032 Transcript_106591/m.340032 type:complete len:211 (-) Transcript_106591:656-1288(-)
MAGAGDVRSAQLPKLRLCRLHDLPGFILHLNEEPAPISEAHSTRRGAVFQVFLQPGLFPELPAHQQVLQCNPELLEAHHAAETSNTEDVGQVLRPALGAPRLLAGGEGSRLGEFRIQRIEQPAQEDAATLSIQHAARGFCRDRRRRRAEATGLRCRTQERGQVGGRRSPGSESHGLVPLLLDVLPDYLHAWQRRLRLPAHRRGAPGPERR